MCPVDKFEIEMGWDGQQFESGVQKSIKTLDQLKSSLNLEESAKSFESLQTNANALDFSNIVDNVNIIASRFTFMGKLVDKIRGRISDSLIDLAKNSTQFVKGLTIDQVGAGWGKYEQKSKAVQTIMNATGMSIEDVNASLDKLTWYTDETSYSFSGMIDNIAKFTSNGIGLDSAVTSMIGIGNAAGLAGASVEDATHAMDGFSKAMGKGFMSTDSWRWIQTAHMDTEKFKKIMIDAAVEAGTLETKLAADGKSFEYYVKGAKKAAVSTSDFQSELHQGWLNTEAMRIALSKFGGATEEIFKAWEENGGEILTSELIKQMADQLDELGIQAFKASQETRTFSDAITAVKEAVSTGWAKTWEYIFGNKDEAVKLWSEVAEELYNVFAEAGNKRNEVLKEWYEGGGRDDLIQSLRDSWETVKSISETIKETFEGLFPEITAKKLLKFTSKVKEFAESFKKNFTVSDEFKKAFGRTEDLFKKLHDAGVTSDIAEQQYKAYQNLQKIKEAFGGLKSILELVKSSFKAFSKIVAPIFDALNIHSVLDFAAALGSLVTKTVDAIINSKALSKVVNGLSTFMSWVVEGWKGAIKGSKELFASFKKSEVATTVLGAFSSFSETISKGFKNGTFIKSISELFRSAKTNLSNTKLFTSITSFFSTISSKINFQTISSGIRKVFSSLTDLKTKFGNKLSTFNTNIRTFWNNVFPDGWTFRVGKIFNSITDFFTNLGTKVNFRTLSASIRTFFGSFSNFKISFGSKLSSFILNLRSFWGSVIPESGLLASAKLSFKEIGASLTGIKDKILALFKVNSFSEFVDNIIDSFKQAKDRIKDTLEDIGETLKKVDWGKVAAVTLALLTALTLLRVGQAFKAASKTFKSLTSLFQNLSTSLTGFVTETTNQVKGLGQLPKKIGNTFDALTKAIENKWKPKIIQLAEAAALFAGAILILVGAMKWLNTMSPEELKKTGIAIGALAVGLATITMVLGSMATKGKSRNFEKIALGVLAISGAIVILAGAMYVLKGLQWGEIGKGLVAISGIMVIIGGMATYLKHSKSNLTGLGLAFISMAASILILTKAISMLSKIENLDMGQAITAIGALVAIMTAFGILKKLSKGSFGLGAGVLAMTLSVIAIMSFIKVLGEDNVQNLMETAKKNIGLIASVFGVLALLTIMTRMGGKNALKAGVGVLALAVSLNLIYGAVKKFGKMDPAVMTAGIIAVAILARVFRGFTKSLGVLDKGQKTAKVGMAMLMMATSMLIIFQAVKKFGALDIATLAKGIVAVSALMVALGFSMKLASAAVKVGPIIAMTVALGVLLAGISLLTLYKPKELLTAVVAIGGVLLALGGAIKWAGSAKFNKANLAGFAIGVGALAGVVAAIIFIKDIPWQQLLASAGAMAGVLLAIGRSIQLAGYYKGLSGGGNLIVGVLGLAAVAFILYQADKYISGSPERIATIAGSLSAMVASLGVAIRLGRGSSFGDSISTVGSVLLGILGIVAILGAFAWLSDYYNITISDQAVENIGKIGEMIGGFIGGIFAGFGAIQTAVLPQMGTDLSNFITNLQPFIDAVGSLPDGFTDKMSVLSEGLLKIGKAELKDAWTNLINNIIDISPDQTFPEKMKSLGEALKEFSIATGDIEPTKIDQNITNLANLLDVFHELPVKYGIGAEGNVNTLGQVIGWLVEGFSGVTDIDKFKTGLQGLGEGLSAFQTATVGVDPDDLTSAVDSLEKLLGAFKQIPNSGGLIQAFFGEHKWDTIGTGLAEFGGAMVGFYEAITGKDGKSNGLPADAPSKIGTACTIASTLSTAISAVPGAGGIIQDFFGDKKWSTLSTDLVAFGEAMVGFYNTISGKDGKSKGLPTGEADLQLIDSACGIGMQLAATLKEAPPEGGKLQEWFGSNTWSGISSGLVEFGEAMVGFSNSLVGTADVAGMDVDVVTAAIDNVATLINAIVTMKTAHINPSELGEGGWFSTGFGQGLEDFGGHVAGMANAMAGVDMEAVNAVLTALDSLANSTTDYGGLGDDLAQAIVEQFTLGLSTFDPEEGDTIASGFLERLRSSFLDSGDEEISAVSAFGNDFAGKFITSIIDGISNDDSAVLFKNFASAFGSGLTTAMPIEDLWSVGEGIAGTILDGFNTPTGQTTITNGSEGLGQSIKSGIETGLSGMESIGANVGQGLINGMSTMLDAVYIVGMALGKRAAEGVAAGAVVQSPSKATFKIGEYVGEGLSLGMLSMTSRIEKSAEQMAGSSILSVASVFDTIDAALAGDLDYNPVITPVLDLSAVSYGASQINGLLNNEASLRLAGEVQAEQTSQDLSEMLLIGRAILKEIQNGSNLYFDDGVLAGRINRRLGSL